jgi:hypothetical protein
VMASIASSPSSSTSTNALSPWIALGLIAVHGILLLIS